MIELILIILVILVVAVISFIAWTDYDKHKKSNVTEFTKVDTDIKTEGATRLSNLKYVVDQVNKTNEDMDTTYTKKFSDIDASLKDYTGFKTGFGSLITARNSSSNIDIPITNLATLPATDVNMMKHVSFLGGATIKDLQNSVDKTDMRLKMCGVGDKPACIELPNADGDTYLTSLVSGKKVVFGAPIKANDTADFYKSINLYNADTATMSLQGTDQGASLSTKGALSVKSGTTEVMNVGSGGVAINGTVTLKNASGTTATLSVGDNGVLKVGNSEVAYVSGTIVQKQPQQPQLEPFCTTVANQNKNYQCVNPTDTNNLNGKYFKLETGGILRPYENELAWQQAINDGRATAADLVLESDCTKFISTSCIKGDTITQSSTK